MIDTLYPTYKRWSEKGSVFIISDTHFEDPECLLMDPDWISPEEQIPIKKNLAHKNDTLIHLGDVGNPEYMKQVKAYKVLLTGNHDEGARKCEETFDEIYTGPLFIAEKILLSHEPVYGLPWCLNIHGHDHNGTEPYREDCKHLNLAANVCGYTPVNLGKLIKSGILSDIDSIHRMTIDHATEKKAARMLKQE